MGVVGVDRDRLLQQLLRPPLLVGARAPHVRQRLQDQIPCIDALRRLAANARRFGDKDLRPDRTDDLVGDVVLQLEDIGQLAIVSVRPQMHAVRGIDQLSGDAHPAGGLAHAALENVPDAELACDVANVDRFTLEGESGIARDDEEPSLPGQPGDDVLGQPVREIFLLRIAAHILKRQHGDRRLVWECKRRRIRDVLQKLSRRRTAACCSRPARRPRPSSIAPTKRKPRLGSVRMRRWLSPLSPTARRAALIQVAERRLRNNPALPDRVDQFVLADDPVAIADQEDQQVEHLRLDPDGLPSPAQLVPPEIDLKLAESEVQGALPK